MYKLISDIWNGYSGDGGFQSCSHGKPHYGSGCMTSITNIRTRGIPFSGKCAALSHGPTPTPPPPSPPTPTPPSSLVSISSRKSGKCLDLAGGEEKNGAILQVWSCQHTNPDANQRWSRRGNEIVHHSSRGGELCVDMTDNNPTDGNHLQVWSCGGTPQQQWVQSGDKFRVGNACMDLRDGKMSDGAKVQVWNCNSPTPENQQWVITPIGGDNSVLV